MARFFVLGLIALPIIEIAVLIKVGQTIGLLPTLALMTDHPGWHDVLPLHACGAFWLFAWDVAAAGKIDPLAFEGAAAIEIYRPFGVDMPGQFFRFAKGAGRFGMSGWKEKQGEQKQADTAHGYLDD